MVLLIWWIDAAVTFVALVVVVFAKWRDRCQRREPTVGTIPTADPRDRYPIWSELVRDIGEDA